MAASVCRRLFHSRRSVIHHFIFLYSIAEYLMLYRVCQPMNIWHGLLFRLMGVGYVGAAVLFPNWLHIVPLDYGCTLILSVFLLLLSQSTVFSNCIYQM